MLPLKLLLISHGKLFWVGRNVLSEQERTTTGVNSEQVWERTLGTIDPTLQPSDSPPVGNRLESSNAWLTLLPLVLFCLLFSLLLWWVRKQRLMESAGEDPLPNRTEGTTSLDLRGSDTDAEIESSPSPFAIPAENLDPEQASICQGYKLLSAKQFNEALSCFDAVTGNLQDTPFYWVGKGWILAELEEYEPALAFLEKAIADPRTLDPIPPLDPDSFTALIDEENLLIKAWFGKGLMLMKLECFAEALSCFEEVLTLAPQHSQAQQLKIRLVTQLEDDALLLSPLSPEVESISLDSPESSRPHSELVLPLSFEGIEPEETDLLVQKESAEIQPEITEEQTPIQPEIDLEIVEKHTITQPEITSEIAEEHPTTQPEISSDLQPNSTLNPSLESELDACNHLLIDQPQSIEILTKKGNLLRQLGRCSEALGCFESILALEPHNITARIHHNNLLLKISDHFTDVNSSPPVTAKNSPPQDIKTCLQQGAIFFETGQFLKARDSFEQALNLNPQSIAALIAKGNTLLRLKQPFDALVPFNQVLTLESHCNEAKIGKGYVLVKIGNPQAAFPYFQPVIQEEPQNALAWFCYGIALAEDQQWEESLYHLEQTITLSPHTQNQAILPLFSGIILTAKAHLERGKVLRQLNRLNESLQSFEKVLHIQTDSIVALREKGNTLLQLERETEALACFEQVSALEQGNSSV